MLDALKSVKLSSSTGETGSIGPLSETDVKKVMLSIAKDVSGGDPSKVSSSGKIGAYGFNAAALEKMGVLKGESVSKAMDSLKSQTSEVTPLVKKTWDKTTASDPLKKLGFSDSNPKTFGTDLASKATKDLGIKIPAVASHAKANVNFSALTDPTLWVAPRGSPIGGVSTAISISKSIVANTIASSIKKLTGLETTSLMQLSLSGGLSRENKSVNSNVTRSLTQIQTSLTRAERVSTAALEPISSRNGSKLPASSLVEMKGASQVVNTALGSARSALPGLFATVLGNPTSGGLQSAIGSAKSLLNFAKTTAVRQLESSLVKQVVSLGGGSKGFLDSPAGQHKAMSGLMQTNYKSLLAAGVITENSPKSTVAGLLAVANGQGPDQAIRYARGANKTSSDGKSSEQYFNSSAQSPGLLKNDLSSNPSAPLALPSNPAESQPAKPTIQNQPSNEGLRNSDPTVGFKDPNNVYPRKGEIGKPDTNTLAAGINSKVPVTGKNEVPTVGGRNASKKTNVPVNGRTGETWEQPNSPYAAQYPHNHVFQSESGHTQEFDDTPKAERVSLSHKSGTFFEMYPDGSQVAQIVGNGYTIIDKNGYISIEGVANVHVGGTCNVFIANACNLTVQGKTKMDFHNDVDISIGGKLSVSVAQGIYVRNDGELSYDGVGDINANTSGLLNLGTAGDINVTSAAGINVESATDMNLKSGANINEQAATNINLKSTKVVSSPVDTATLNVTTANVTTLNAGTTNLLGTDHTGPDHVTDIKGTTTATVSDVAEAKDPTPPDITVVDAPVAQLSPTDTTFSPTDGVSVAEKINMDYDGEDGIADEATAIANGAEVGGTPPDSQEDASVDSGKIAVTACNITRKKVTLPEINITTGVNYGMKISDYFTLKDVMVSGKLRAFGGFSQRDMIANMRCLAVNCLDPIRDKYPSLFLTSGFRDYVPKGGSSTSQHMLGQAVDMKFNGFSKTQYFDIVKWIGANIPHDQLMNEYTASGGCWIHISFKPNGQGNRSQNFTMYNHHRTSEFGSFKKY